MVNADDVQLDNGHGNDVAANGNANSSTNGSSSATDALKHPIQHVRSHQGGSSTPNDARNQHKSQPLGEQGQEDTRGSADGHAQEPGKGFSESVQHALGRKHGNGGDRQQHPGLERNQSSEHIRHSMPDTAWAPSKQEEFRQRETGEWDVKQAEIRERQNQAATIAANTIRKARGEEPKDDTDGGANLMDDWAGDGKKGKGDGESHAIETYASRTDRPQHKAPDSSKNVADEREKEANRRKAEEQEKPENLTQAQKAQRRLLEHPEDFAREARGQEEVEPKDGERKNERQLKEGEHGLVPDKLPALRDELAPGPRQEIHLKPRTPEMHFHTDKSNDSRPQRDRVPLKVSADGETENLPDGRVFRRAPDQDDKLTRTRSEEEKTLRLAMDEDDRTYDSHRMLRAQHVGGNPEDGMVPGRVQMLGQDDDGQGGENASSDDDREARNNPGKTAKVLIPRADHDARDDDGAAMSSAQTPGSRRPKTQRLWSTFREGQGRSQPRRNSSKGPQPPTIAEGQFSSALQMDRPVEPQGDTPAQKKWSVLRQKLLNRQGTLGASSTPAEIPITSELLAGQLPVMIMKTWLDRDEHGRRAVPILLGNLHFRVGDSAGIGSQVEQSSSGKEVFRIECQYGDGAVKWVIYRELRDFLSLHAHYKADNLGTRVSHFGGVRRVEIPEFPRSSIPYLGRVRLGNKEAKVLGLDNSEDEKQEEQSKKGKSRQEQSRQSRIALQQYLVDLIRAVMFRPESNRLCKFFELSSLTVSLAPRGGFQGKAGFLRMSGSSASKRANQPGLLPGSWMRYKSPKWWIVRDSYLVATDGPESTDLFEVFLIDGDFAIERPKRVIRQGLSKLTGSSSTPQKTGGSGTAQSDRQKAIAAAAGSGHALENNDGKHQAALAEGDGRAASQHTFFIQNSQMRLKLVAKNVRQMQQFIISMERIATQCIWRSRNRFDSFAPIRMNVAAQWLVDGRDYLWNLSRAMNMAKDRIYIHDWWLSPELYLRRPGNERYRLDNILKRKAEEGVKVFIIIYNEVSSRTTPVDSLYAKKRLGALHPNILVQRSPSHFQTGTFYWSHHEKMCVIDETIAFMGGIDLCFGRWDTPQHVLVDDDAEPGATGDKGPVWPGKDLCNDRVTDPFALNKPFDDMFDRTKVPRMPWHDVGLQMVGQPARDLCRHFVQRWNYLIRTKNHTRPMPFLLPPADYTEHELKHLRLQGTCEVQICRSCGPWSMGTGTKVEHSIQNAYIKSIQLSEHFVYIENQFFITSTVVDGVEVENRIGDALVDRIIRAHKEGTKWHACIVIPLIPGYAHPIDTAEASSVRLIIECQNRSICRGTQSIFSRLRKEGIDPDDYITFFSLRGWGKFKSGALTTEQVYIHGKTMVVDDRLVICGSANINERSQRGDRDSELVAVVRDTDMIESKMGGKPYKVGRYAHTLRVRLMREHLGVDVDAIAEDQLMTRAPVAPSDEIQKWDPDHEQKEGEEHVDGVTTVKRRHARDRFIGTVASGMAAVTKGVGENVISDVKKVTDVVVKPVAIVKEKNTILGSSNSGEAEERQDQVNGQKVTGFASSVVPTLEEKTILERRPSQKHTNGTPLFDALDQGQGSGQHDAQEARVPQEDLKKFAEKPVNAQQDGGSSSAPKVGESSLATDKFGAPANANDEDDIVPNDGTDRKEATDVEKEAVKARATLRKHLDVKVGVSPWTMPTPTPKIDPDAFGDPLCTEFWKDMWVASAVHNTEIYRKVFRCIPDDLVTSWAAYKSFVNHAEKFNRTPTDVGAEGHEPVKVVHGGAGTHGAGGGGSGGGVVEPRGGDSGPEKGKHVSDVQQSDIVNGKPRDGDSTFHGNPAADTSEVDRTPSGADDPWAEWEKNEMEELLQELRGHLGEHLTAWSFFNSPR